MNVKKQRRRKRLIQCKKTACIAARRESQERYLAIQTMKDEMGALRECVKGHQIVLTDLQTVPEARARIAEMARVLTPVFTTFMEKS